MPVNTLGPVNMVAQSMAMGAGTQGMFEGGMAMRAQGMDGKKPGGARIFSVSPAVGGKTIWNLDADGSLSVLVTSANTQNTLTITPLFDCTIQVSAWGQGGGSSNGGYMRGAVQLDAGAAYVLTCGRGPGQGGTGDSGPAPWGGGYTGVFRGSVAQNNSVLVAGGGGGAGNNGAAPGGDGGYPTGAVGSGTNAPDGGTQLTGGANNGGPESTGGTSGSALQGGRGNDRSVPGNGWTGGGGGGGGFFGGGGGPGGGSYSGGGGGGSSYASARVSLSSSTFSAGLTDPRRTNSAGTNYVGLLVVY